MNYPNQNDDSSRRPGHETANEVVDSRDCARVRSFFSKIDLDLTRLIDHVENGIPFKDNPLAQFGIKKHRRREDIAEYCFNELVEKTRRQTLDSVPLWISDKLRELEEDAVTEGLMHFVVGMWSLNLWEISLEGKRISATKMWIDYAATVAQSKAIEAVQAYSGRGEKKALTAARLYETYHTLIRELRRLYFSSQSRKRRLVADDWTPWKEKKLQIETEYPDLVGIMDRIPFKQYGRSGELALEIIADRFGVSVGQAQRLVTEGNKLLDPR
jgi:hypothetical protein